MKKTITALLCLILCLTPLFALAEDATQDGGLKGGKAVIPVITGLTRYEIPDNEAMRFLRDMKVGWNLGNTFDAINDAYSGDEMDLETIWVSVRTTETMMDQLVAAGFKTLRLPVSWHGHVDPESFEISEAWLSRVQEVADWALSRGMYVILNTHHDEEQFYPSSEQLDESLRYINTVWGQIAERFRDYDDHLIFESMNEPRLTHSKTHEWWFDAHSAEIKDAAACINQLNQAFVDTVRASGGNNADRYLMVPGYDASADGVTNQLFVLPKDSADNRIIVSVHAYTPYNFALNLQGTRDFSINNRASVSEIRGFMNKLYTMYIAKGIPVVIGEFGALDKQNNLQARVDFTAYYTAQAISRGIPVCWWDNNSFSGNGENFGLLRRLKENWLYPDIVLAMMSYASIENLQFE